MKGLSLIFNVGWQLLQCVFARLLLTMSILFSLFDSMAYKFFQQPLSNVNCQWVYSHSMAENFLQRLFLLTMNVLFILQAPSRTFLPRPPIDNCIDNGFPWVAIVLTFCSLFFWTMPGPFCFCYLSFCLDYASMPGPSSEGMSCCSAKPVWVGGQYIQYLAFLIFSPSRLQEVWHLN